MKNNNNYLYSNIDSFEDFSTEKQRLMMKRTAIEARLNQSFLRLQNVFSVSNMVLTLAKEFVMPKISSFVGALIKKVAE